MEGSLQPVATRTASSLLSMIRCDPRQGVWFRILRLGVSMLNLQNCRTRMGRFCSQLVEEEIDLAILSNYRNVYYLSGHLREVESPQLLIVTPEGSSILITDVLPTQTIADEVLAYENYSIDWPVSF